MQTKNNKLCATCKTNERTSYSTKCRACINAYMAAWLLKKNPSKGTHSAHIYGALEKRFWPKVDKTQGHGPKGDCWLWTAAKLKAGYGILYAGRGKTPHRAPQVAWTLTHGAIPKGAHVLHKCDFPPCCNPKHLFLGDNMANIADRNKKDRGGRKLTNAKVRQIKLDLRNGVMQKTLANRYGVYFTTISKIAQGLAWKHVS